MFLLQGLRTQGFKFRRRSLFCDPEPLATPSPTAPGRKHGHSWEPSATSEVKKLREKGVSVIAIINPRRQKNPSSRDDFLATGA